MPNLFSQLVPTISSRSWEDLEIREATVGVLPTAANDGGRTGPSEVRAGIGGGGAAESECESEPPASIEKTDSDGLGTRVGAEMPTGFVPDGSMEGSVCGRGCFSTFDCGASAVFSRRFLTA